eukprot:15358682-Ditylum_brightwellii.AAC.1
MNLPPSFTVKDSKEKEESEESGNEDTNGRKRKNKNWTGNDKEKSQTVTNTHQVKEFQLKEGESWEKTFCGKLDNKPPFWKGTCKMCAKSHIQGFCFKDCPHKESHVPEKEVKENKRKDARPTWKPPYEIESEDESDDESCPEYIMRYESDSNSDKESSEDEDWVGSYPPRKSGQSRRITKKKKTLPKTNAKPLKDNENEKKSTKVHWVSDNEKEESNIIVEWNKDGKIDSSVSSNHSIDFIKKVEKQGKAAVLAQWKREMNAEFVGKLSERNPNQQALNRDSTSADTQLAHGESILVWLSCCRS